jgi:hypothetical protein
MTNAKGRSAHSHWPKFRMAGQMRPSGKFRLIRNDKPASIRKISGVGPDGERGRRCEHLAAGGHKWRSRRSGRGLTPFLDASPNAT